MDCPRCDHPTKVLRTTTRAGEVSRRRACPSCGHRLTTIERDAASGIEARARKALTEAQELIAELTTRHI